MKTVPLSGLSEDARRLLADAEQAGGLIVEDENGRPRSRVYAYPEPSQAEKEAARERLRAFREKVQQSFNEQGVTEDDLDRLLADEP